MPMASNYTCRACSKALSRGSYLNVQTKWLPRRTSPCIPLQARRGLATSPASEKSDKKKSSDSIKPSINKPLNVQPTLAQKFAGKIREKAPLLTETYVAYGATQELIKECARPGDYTIPQALEKKGEIPTDDNGVHLGVGKGWWYETLGMTPTFSNWAQITFIHMYMLQVRFRMLPSTHASTWIQHLTNHAFYAAEDRLVVWHKFNANSLRQKYMKDMFSQWRAVLLAYDEGLVKGDAVLAAALWRNLLGGREDVDLQKLAQVVSYMKKEIRRLDEASDDVVVNGGWKFHGDPGLEAEIVARPSKSVQEEKKKA